METEAETKKSAGRKALIFPLVALLLGGGGGFGAAWFFASPGEAAPADGEEGAAEAGDGEAAAAGEPGAPAAGGELAAPAVGSAVTSLGTFTVNLRGGGGGRVLRIEVQVEGPTAQAETVAAKTAQIRDSIITAVSDYTWGELEGAGGKTRLRDELLARVNGAASPSQIERIYFTQFVVQ